MRLKYKKPTLLDFDADQPSILYQIHKRLSTDLKGTLIRTTSSDEIPAYASHTDASACLVITGSKINKSTPVSLKIKGDQKFSSCSIWRISGSEFDYKANDVQKAVKNDSIAIDLQPGEVVVAVFK